MQKLIALGALLFTVYLIINLSQSVWGLWQKQGEIDKAREKVERFRNQQKSLTSELEYVKGEEFVERQAREKLKLVRPEETVVIIPESVLKAATASASPTPPPPNWEQWMRLFF